MSSSDQSDGKSSQQAPPPSPSPKWSVESVALKDFSSKRSVPGFAKVVKGSYMTLGHSKFSFQKQHQEVFIHSVRVGVKVLAHCLRRVESHGVARRGSHSTFSKTRLYAVDQRLAVPISYQGWFELLSEDGKSARPISSVHELAKVRPDRCLVRENVKAYLLNDDGKMTFDNTKIVIAGEQLLLNGEISLPTAAENKKTKLLRCIDLKGDTVYLSFDQKGTFTPIAGEKDFTGVFSIRDVVRRFRLPLTVKLVMGVRPKVDPSKFTGLIRLDWVYTDETAFVCPIEKNHVRLLPVPKETQLQLVAATNQQAMKSTELYRTMMAKCNRMVSNYNNTLHLIVQVPDAVVKGKSGRSSANANVFSLPFEAETSAPASVRSRIREERLMNEIDNLYACVRDGGAPTQSSKFAYDSDEESYWEEPAYEPLDEFQARLRALEAGQTVTYPAQYQPRDPAKLDLETATSKRSGDAEYGVLETKTEAPPLPPRPPDLLANSPPTDATAKPPPNTRAITPGSQQAPPLPTSAPPVTRRLSTETAVTTVSNRGLVSSYQSSTSLAPHHHPPPGPGLYHSKSAGDVHHSATRHGRRKSHESASTSGSSSGHGARRNLARDFRDSDMSSLTRAGSSGSSGNRVGAANIRKKMQTLYL